MTILQLMCVIDLVFVEVYNFSSAPTLIEDTAAGNVLHIDHSHGWNWRRRTYALRTILGTDHTPSAYSNIVLLDHMILVVCSFNVHTQSARC